MTPEDEERRARILADWRPTYPFTVRTLRDHVYVRSSVSATCAACRYTGTLSLLDLIEKCGPETTLDAVVRNLRCTRCGSREPPEITIGYDSRRTPEQRRP